MTELVTYLARSLAGRPDEVGVTENVGDKGLTLDLKVADEDRNHLIGKQWRTIKAMRSLLAAATVKDGRRVFLKISSSSSANNDDISAPDESSEAEEANSTEEDEV